MQHPKEDLFQIGYSIFNTATSYHRILGVETLKDGYVCNVPLLRVKWIQSVSHGRSHELITPSRCIQTETLLPDYSPVSSWIPMLPKLGRLLALSQRIL
jgi:hypothetical protein